MQEIAYILITFEETACNPTELLSMTGYTFDEFNALRAAFEQAVFECDRTLEGKERENKPTVYKNSPFPSIADQLFFILVYMKQYTTQTVLGKLFGISQPKANLWIHYLMPILSSSNVEILQPTKKPRGKELTQEEKDRNRNISKIRVRIEHVISGVKRYRIVKDKFRNWVRGFNDLVIGIACGLHNLRLRFCPWKEVKIQDI